MRVYTKFKGQTGGARKNRARKARNRWLAVAAVLLAAAAVFWFWGTDKWPVKRLPLPGTRPADQAPGPVPTNRAPFLTPGPATNALGGVSSNALPPPPSSGFDEDTLRVQVEFVRHGISSGSLDGVFGGQTRKALMAFQESEKLLVTGLLDAATRARLTTSTPLWTYYQVTSNDLARLQPLAQSFLGKSQQTRLDYESLLEMMAEKGKAHPALMRRLNPGLDWTRVPPGTVVRLPNATYPPGPMRASFVRIRLAEKTLAAFDERTNLLAHFPCSIARKAEKRPIGMLQVVRIAPNPNYRFDPALFSDLPEARQIGRPLILPPGPNNPVGTAWIGLDRPGYGIHGTPRPEEIGRTESLGCFRLANWNAEFLLTLVWSGMPVYVEP